MELHKTKPVVDSRQTPKEIIGHDYNNFCILYARYFKARAAALAENRAFTPKWKNEQDELIFKSALRKLIDNGVGLCGLNYDDSVKFAYRRLPEYSDGTQVQPGQERREEMPAEPPKERATDEERAERIAIHKAAARGLISPDEAYARQKAISDRLDREGRGGECNPVDFMFAHGAGSRQVPGDFEPIKVLVERYLDRLAGK